MAEREQSNGFNPKHRIIGAVILVATAVIVVPLVLNKREPPRNDTNSGGPTKTVIAEVPPPANATPTPIATPPRDTKPSTAPLAAPPSEISVKQSAAAETPPNEPAVVPAAPKSAPASKAEVKSPSKPAGKGWYVQVGTFSNPKNAQSLADKLKHKGVPAATETVSVERNKVTRVRIGPYTSETQARKAQSDIQRRVGINGIVRQVK